MIDCTQAINVATVHYNLLKGYESSDRQHIPPLVEYDSDLNWVITLSSLFHASLNGTQRFSLDYRSMVITIDKSSGKLIGLKELTEREGEGGRKINPVKPKEFRALAKKKYFHLGLSYEDVETLNYTLELPDEWFELIFRAKQWSDGEITEARAQEIFKIIRTNLINSSNDKVVPVKSPVQEAQEGLIKINRKLMIDFKHSLALIMENNLYSMRVHIKIRNVIQDKIRTIDFDKFILTSFIAKNWLDFEPTYDRAVDLVIESLRVLLELPLEGLSGCRSPDYIRLWKYWGLE